MILNFPSNPSVNDTYSFGGKTWVFNGQGWVLASTGALNGVIIGNTTPATGNFTTVGAQANITTDQYFIGNGAFLTGIAAGYSNADVANYLPTYTGNLVSLTGNITTSANISGSYFLGNGAFLTGLPESYSNANVAAYLPNYQGLISNVDFRSTSPAAVALVVTDRPLTMGGNALSYVTLPDDGNANSVAAELTNHGFGNVLISAGPSDYEWIFDHTGNLSLPGNTFAVNYANGQAVSIAGTYSNVNVKAYIESGATINANFGGGNIITNGTANLGPTTVNGNLSVSGNISATGNITYINVQDLVIDDPLIYLAANNPGDTEDIGIVGSYNDGTYAHTGFVRDHIDDTWKVFSGVTSEPNTIVAWNEAVYAAFKAGPILSNATITANANITAVGNVSGTYLLGNGAFITGLPAGYSNADVKNYLGNFDGNIIPSANITYNLGSNTNRWNDLYLNNSTIYIGAQEITANADATIFSGNISANYLLGNGALLAGVSNYSNANVVSYLASNANITLSLGTGNITTQGNVSVGNLVGSGDNVDLRSGTYTWSFNNTGNLVLPANSFSINYANGTQVSIGGTYSNSNVSAYLASNANIPITVGVSNITTQGNIAGNYFIGNGALLTGVVTSSYSNANVANYLPTYTGNVSAGNLNLTGNIVDTGALTIITGSSGNVTLAPGNTSILTATTTGVNIAGYLNTTGNITVGNLVGSGDNVDLRAGSYTWTFNNAGNFVLPGNTFAVNYANGSQVSLSGTYSNTNVAAYLPTYTGAITSLAGNVTTTANISGNYILGNGAFLTGLPVSYSNANVANYLPTYTGNLASLTGNVTTTANVAGAWFIGNINATNTITTSGNITANNFIGSDPNVGLVAGSYTWLFDNTGNVTLSGNTFAVNYANGTQVTLGGTYSNSNVAAYLQVYNGNALFSNITVSRDAVITGNLRVDGNTTYINVSDLVIEDKDIIVAANASATLSDLNGAGLQIGNRTAGGNITFFYNSTSNVMTLSHGANIANVLNVSGNITATGNLSAGNVIGSGNNVEITANSYNWVFDNTGNIVLAGNTFAVNYANGTAVNLAGTYSNTNVAAYLPTYTGNVAAGNLNITGNIVDTGALTIITGAAGNITLAPNGTSVLTVTTTGVNVAGTLNASGNITGGNLIGSGANVELQAGSYSWVFNDAGNIVLAGNTFAVNYANGTAVSLAGTYSNTNVAAYLPTYTGAINSLAGNVTTTANISGNYFIGNGSLLTGVVTSSYSNANVANYLPTYTGNVSAGNLNITGNIVDTGALTIITGAAGNIALAPGGTNVLTVTTTGVNVTGTFNASGNITGGNLIGSGTNVELQAGSYSWVFDNTGNVVLAGNTFAVNYANGTPVSLAGTYSNANVLNYLQSGATINANFGGGNIATAGTANLGTTQVNGNLIVAGNISATGNITYINVQDLVVDDPLIYLGANNTGNVEDLGIVASYNDGTYQHTGFARDYTDGTWKVFQGVTSEPNTVIAWNEAVMAPFKAGPILSNASITANANVVASGNVSGAYLLGNGYFVSGIQYGNITGAYSNATVANYLASNAAVTILTTANITTSANISAGNIVGTGTNTTITTNGYTWTFDNQGNLTAPGNAVVTANVLADYFIGNGAFLTGLPAGYSNADAANYLASNANVTITTTGNITTSANISANYLFGNGSQLTGINVGGNLQVITRASGAVNFAILYGFLPILGRSGTINIPIST